MGWIKQRLPTPFLSSSFQRNLSKAGLWRADNALSIRGGEEMASITSPPLSSSTAALGKMDG